MKALNGILNPPTHATYWLIPRHAKNKKIFFIRIIEFLAAGLQSAAALGTAYQEGDDDDDDEGVLVPSQIVLTIRALLNIVLHCVALMLH